MSTKNTLSPTLLPELLLKRVREQFLLDWTGIHGLPHWKRVHQNGIRIASLREADLGVIELFSYLHDSCREDDGYETLSTGPELPNLPEACRVRFSN